MKEEKAMLYLIIFLLIALLSVFGYCIYKGWTMESVLFFFSKK